MIKVGIQGDHGSFSETAALEYIKRHNITDYAIIYLINSDPVLEALSNDKIDYGIIAIKNSIGGTVKESTEALKKYKVNLIEEFSIPIHQNLMCLPETHANQITEIHSHPQALKQSSIFLNTQFNKIKCIAAKDTALAARQLQAGDLPPTAAIIGNVNAAKEYNLSILFRSIENDKSNRTTFQCLQHKTCSNFK